MLKTQLKSKIDYFVNNMIVVCWVQRSILMWD